MLKELAPHLDHGKFNDLSTRLDLKDTKTALAAEAELTVLWALSRVADLELEPKLPGSTNRPDAGSNNLFASAPAVIEVRALSDDSFSGKEAMDLTANKIAAYAERIRKGAGKHLYFEFNEKSYWKRRMHRERCVDPNFQLTNEIKQILRQWICAEDWPNPERIRICKGKTDVVISWQTSASKHFRTFCKMPPVAYDHQDNPIYKALKRKANQLKGAAEGTIKCVVLFDVGCSLLRRLRPMSAVHEIGGDEIIRYALQKLRIDSVVVLSPYRKRNTVFVATSTIYWNVTVFDARETIPEEEYALFKAMAEQLPAPYFEGYQARDLHRQGSFRPESRRWYVPTKIRSAGTGKMTIKLSAGLLHEYLAGKLSGEEFSEKAFGKEQNIFASELVRGNSIRSVEFESAGIDEDDDYVVFELDIDWDKIARKSDEPNNALDRGSKFEK